MKLDQISVQENSNRMEDQLLDVKGQLQLTKKESDSIAEQVGVYLVESAWELNYTFSFFFSWKKPM